MPKHQASAPAAERKTKKEKETKLSRVPTSSKEKERKRKKNTLEQHSEQQKGTIITTEPKTKKKKFHAKATNVSSSSSSHITDSASDDLPTRTRAMMMDEVEETSIVSRDHTSNKYYTTLPSSTTPPENSFDLTDYESWNAQQVTSVLISRKSLGGDGLSVEKLKPLYEAGFDGSSLHNIVENIQDKDKHYALDQFKNTLKDSGFRMTFQLSNTCQTVVSWANDRIVLPRQKSQNLLKAIEQGHSSSQQNSLDLTDYESWNAQQVTSVLTSRKSLGGAGLSFDDVKPLCDAGFKGSSLHNIVENIMKKDEYFALDQLKSTYNKNNVPQLSDTCQIIVSWANDRIVLPRQKSQNLLKEIEQARHNMETNFERFYSKTRGELATMYPKMVLKAENFDDFEQTLRAKTDIPSVKTKFGYPNFGEQYRSAKLPLMTSSLAKHELPYFTQFQYTMAQDDEVLKRLAPKTKRSTLMFMGPSGAGKTSACVRLLCRNPGMVLTCTSSSEVSSGLTTDSLMRQAFGYLKGQDIFELFGSVEQVVLMVFICRLIYISKLIDEAKQNPNVFKYFAQRDRNENIVKGGILPYLAYMQSNGKTSASREALTYALKFVYSDPEILKSFVAILVNKIIHSLNDNSALFGIVKKIEYFIVVIDEANVYEGNNSGSNNLSELISLSGEKRGLLTKFAQSIGVIENFHLSIFSGTNFYVDVGSIIQSALGKTEAKIDVGRIYDFGLVARDDIISFLEKHIKIPNNERQEILFYLHERGYKYFRRRLITLALENFSTHNSLIDAIKLSVDEFVLGAKKRVEPYLDTYNSTQAPRLDTQQAIQEGIQQAIVKYVTHYHFPFLGSEFKVHIDGVADALLYSGFCGPESSENNQTRPNFVFSAKDFIGYEIGLEILKKILKIEDKSKLMKQIIQERIKLLLQSSDHNIDLESIVMLRLAELDGTRLSKIGCFKPLITNNPILKGHIFKCKHCLDANGYVEYCISKQVIAPENKKDMNGEELFWTHFSKKKWDLLDGVFITPSNEHHNDLFGINRVNDSTDMIIPIGFQCKVQSGAKFDPHSYFSSTIPELFYLDNYGKLKSDTLYNLNCNHVEETKIKDQKQYRFVVMDKSKKIIDDANGKGMKVSSSAKWYSGKRNDILQVFKSSKMMQVCIGFHTTETFSNKIVKKYQQNYLCSFIDMSNYDLLFDKEWETYLRSFLTTVAERVNSNNKKNNLEKK